MDIIITGAGKGIGFELVKLFLQQKNDRIIGISRDIRSLEKLQAAQLYSLQADLHEPKAFTALLDIMRLMNFTPGLLVNNAGSLVNKPIDTLSDGDFDLMFGTNVKAVFRMVKALLPHFAPGAHILNIGSMGGFQGSAKFAGLSLYSASKAALAVMTECMAEEFKDRGVKANCLALGAAQTEMLSLAFPGYKAPLSAAEMAGFIADFARNGHHYFNGKILPVSVSTP
ncbi:MAG: SDR family oxidoreductase [Bacteroidales bacterium]|nr:SDR family oxidoreductase [Bacteroidales bacterium]